MAPMVFPGGSREVWSPGQRYELLWGDRLGFARMAIEHGYPIVPLSQLGGDEIYNVAFDVEHRAAGPYRAVVDKLGLRRNDVPSFGLGWGGTLLPRPQDAYIHLAAVETASLANRHEDRKALEPLRDQVQAAIREGLEHLRRERATRGNPGIARPIGRVVTKGSDE